MQFQKYYEKKMEIELMKKNEFDLKHSELISKIENKLLESIFKLLV